MTNVKQEALDQEYTQANHQARCSYLKMGIGALMLAGGAVATAVLNEHSTIVNVAEVADVVAGSGIAVRGMLRAIDASAILNSLDLRNRAATDQ